MKLTVRPHLVLYIRKNWHPKCWGIRSHLVLYIRKNWHPKFWGLLPHLVLYIRKNWHPKFWGLRPHLVLYIKKKLPPSINFNPPPINFNPPLILTPPSISNPPFILTPPPIKFNNIDVKGCFRMIWMKKAIYKPFFFWFLIAWNGLVYRKKPKWLTRSRDIFQMAISSFIFNIETSSLKRWTT